MTEELAYSFGVQTDALGAMSVDGLRGLQLARLNETLAWAHRNSSFYREHIAQGKLSSEGKPLNREEPSGLEELSCPQELEEVQGSPVRVSPSGPQEPSGPKELSSLEELPTLPLMDESALVQHSMAALLATGQDEVCRIVTASTSGTTGEPKRIAFTEEEHSGIVRYFASGMRMLAGRGETIAVLYPCERTGGLGRLICEAVEQAGSRACAYGLPDAGRGFGDLAQACLKEQVKGLVGFPQHIFALAQWCAYQGIELFVKSVLLSADNVAPSLKQRIQQHWNAQVYAHYGTTEMGYGGAVECPCGSGLHVRETDLLFEVIDPESGEVLPEGEYGELVFTTLNRHAMPFIRFRTGDMTRLLPGSCQCGSILRRIDVIKGRANDQLPITMYELEDAVFALEGVLDFSARWDSEAGSTERTLTLEVQVLPRTSPDSSELCQSLRERVQADVQIREAVSEEFRPFYAAKRVLMT